MQEETTRHRVTTMPLLLFQHQLKNIDLDLNFNILEQFFLFLDHFEKFWFWCQYLKYENEGRGISGWWSYWYWWRWCSLSKGAVWHIINKNKLWLNADSGDDDEDGGVQDRDQVCKTEHICLQRQTRNSICMKEQLNQCALWKYRTNTAVSIDILYNVLQYTFIIPNDCWVHSFVLLLYILLRERLKLQKPRIHCEQIEPRGGSMLLYVGQDAFEIPSFFFFCW